MRTSPLSCRFAVGLCGLALVASRLGAAEPTANDLIALARAIRSDDAAIKTIEVAGYYRHEGRLSSTFRALYKAPNRFAFLVSGGYDNTPVSFAAGRNLLVYDPIRPELIVFRDVGAYYVIDIEDGKLDISSGFQFVGSKPERLVLDLGAVLAPRSKDGVPADVRVVKTGERNYTLIRRTEDAFYRSRIDLTRPYPFTTLEVAKAPTAEPHYCVDKIIVNGGLDDAAFRFPTLDGLPDGLKVREVRKASVLSEADGAAVLLRSLYTRTKLHDPVLSRGILGPAMLGVRWGRARENDERYAAVVRGLVPPATESRPYYRPVKTDDPEAIRRTNLQVIRDHLPGLPFKVSIKIK